MSPPAKTIRAYDFRRTDLLERVDLQAIEGMVTAFVRSATQLLTSTLRHPCTLALERVDQVTWGEAGEELEQGFYAFVFSLPPMAGQGVLAIPTEEALALVDLRLAGTGDEDYSGRVPSDIDQSFLAPIVSGVLAELATAFHRAQATTPSLDGQEGNIQFVSIAAPAEMCTVARCMLTVAERPCRESVLCLPSTTVRALLDALRNRAPAGAANRPDRFSDDARRRIMEVPLDVVFQFPSFSTTPADLLMLQVGDRLGLGHPKGRPLEVRAEGKLVALAEICSSGVHKACEITEEVTK